MFFTNQLNLQNTQNIILDALTGMDDGELFLEFNTSEALVFDDGKLKTSSFDTSQGFGLRAVLGERIGYAHSSVISEDEIKKTANTIKYIKSGYDGLFNVSGAPANPQNLLYTDKNPFDDVTFTEKVTLLAEIDAYVRKNPLVSQVSITLAAEHQCIEILRADGFHGSDKRPLVRLTISVVVEKDGRMERGSDSTGGRKLYTAYISNWKKVADEAVRQALVNLEAIPAPAGEMPVVLGSGWPGVLLHEAVGHGLEGDFNRKKTSVFSGLMGERIASKGVTIVDDGTIPDRRGSITIDDEGTPSENTVLIEDGILTGYMQDRLNARIMGVKPTGNGRREDYASPVIPRMTNTYMLAGNNTLDEMISSVKRGIYAVNFGGGQVDITSGKFVFSSSESYMIEDGKITSPIKGATLIGNGADVLTKVDMIGNNMELDGGVGTCGKDGQGVPVGVGQPELLISNLTVGGTAV